MNLLFCFAVFILTFTVDATTRKPAELKVRTTFGDRKVDFRAMNVNGQITIERLVDGKNFRSKKLKKKDWDFLIAEFKKLPIAKKIPHECERAKMELTLYSSDKKIHRVSCFGIKTNTSGKYVRYARILSVAL